jgi:endonuclease/exonuclease/phosphatase family metal-dependent hydrolase
VRRAGAVSVATWNIRAGIGPGEPFPAGWWRHVRRERIEAIAAFIRALDVDVLVLQEVALGSVDGRAIDQPAGLGALTGMDARYGALHHYTLVEPEDDRPVGAVLWGNALLSRLPIRATAVHALPIPADDDLVEPEGTRDRRSGELSPAAGVRYAEAGIGPREARCALECLVDAGGTTVRVVTTHLAYVGRAQRFAQSAAVASLVEAHGPTVVAGDLNAAAGDPELAPLDASLTDAFTATGTRVGDPARGSCGSQPIDHVFVRGLDVLECGVARDAGDLSDHWPIVASLALP